MMEPVSDEEDIHADRGEQVKSCSASVSNNKINASTYKNAGVKTICIMTAESKYHCKVEEHQSVCHRLTYKF